MDGDYDVLLKLVIVGCSGAGKTNIIGRYTNNTFLDSTRSTIGVEFMSKQLKIGDQRIKCQIWDTAGQEKYRAVVSAYYRGSSGTIVVYDVCNKESFDSVRDWVKEIRSYIGDKTPILLVGNKSDKEHLRVIDHKEGEALALEMKTDFIETSAKSGNNVDEAFQNIIKKSLIIHQENLDKKKKSTKTAGSAENIPRGSSVDLRTNSGSCCLF
ncbi:MAG: hypothetical protein MHMPM18_002320 [Marteilia pararefringens]